MLHAWPRGDQQPDEADYLFVMPKLLWPTHLICGDRVKPRGRARQRIIQQHIARALDGDWASLAADSLHGYRANVPESMGLEPCPEDPAVGAISQEAAKRVIAAARRTAWSWTCRLEANVAYWSGPAHT